MKNLHLDLIRVTEAGAIFAAQHVGKGDKLAADKAATDAIYERLNKIDFSADIAIGEGKKDKSHGLFEGDKVGALKDDPERRFGNCYEIAIDPIEGTTPTADGGYEAMSCIALAGKGCFYRTERHYMKKIAVGPSALFKLGNNKNVCNIDIQSTVEWNVRGVAVALNKPQNQLSVCVLDRPRHAKLISELRRLGCCIKVISDCDVSACIATCFPDSGIDMFIGIGGAPEAVITAAAMKCLGGYFQCQEVQDDVKDFFCQPPDEKTPVLGLEDLAKGECMFAATGITHGRLLEGVRFTSRGAVTHSLAMRWPSMTVRRMETQHGN